MGWAVRPRATLLPGERRNPGVTMTRSPRGARKPGVLTRGSWERKGPEDVAERLCWGLGRLGPEAVLGGGQCSQLISSLSGCALSELISFVERDNESVFRPMNLGRSGSDGLPPTPVPPGPLLVACDTEIFLERNPFSASQFTRPQPVL